MMGRVSARNSGIQLRTPAVSAQPGCIACTCTPVPARRWANCPVSTSSSRLVRA
jgi:hypothetical protein